MVKPFFGGRRPNFGLLRCFFAIIWPNCYNGNKAKICLAIFLDYLPTALLLINFCITNSLFLFIVFWVSCSSPKWFNLLQLIIHSAMTLLNTCGCNKKNYNKVECRLVVLIVRSSSPSSRVVPINNFCFKRNFDLRWKFCVFHSLNNYFSVISLNIGVGFGGWNWWKFWCDKKAQAIFWLSKWLPFGDAKDSVIIRWPGRWSRELGAHTWCALGWVFQAANWVSNLSIQYNNMNRGC